MGGSTVVHRWMYEGEVKAEVPFDVGGPRWRAHSTKTLDPGWLGEWTVKVVDVNGETLHTQSFRYDPAPASAPAAPDPAMEEPEATDAADEPGASNGLGREL